MLPPATTNRPIGDPIASNEVLEKNPTARQSTVRATPDPAFKICTVKPFIDCEDKMIVSPDAPDSTAMPTWGREPWFDVPQYATGTCTQEKLP